VASQGKLLKGLLTVTLASQPLPVPRYAGQPPVAFLLVGLFACIPFLKSSRQKFQDADRWQTFFKNQQPFLLRSQKLRSSNQPNTFGGVEEAKFVLKDCDFSVKPLEFGAELKVLLTERRIQPKIFTHPRRHAHQGRKPNPKQKPLP